MNCNDCATTTLLINLGFQMPAKSSVESSIVIFSYPIQVSFVTYRGQEMQWWTKPPYNFRLIVHSNILKRIAYVVFNTKYTFRNILLHISNY